MAAVTAQTLPGIARQALVFAVLDLAGIGATASYPEFGSGYFLTRRNMDYFARSYAGEVGGQAQQYSASKHHGRPRQPSGDDALLLVALPFASGALPAATVPPAGSGTPGGPGQNPAVIYINPVSETLSLPGPKSGARGARSIGCYGSPVFSAWHSATRRSISS